MLTRLRQDLNTILTAALEAVRPRTFLPSLLKESAGSLHIGETSLPTPDGRLAVLAMGKAAQDMAESLAGTLSSIRPHGWILTPTGHGHSLSGFQIREAAHPVPDTRNLASTQEILKWAGSDLPPEAPLLVLLSGGSSALFCLPAEGLTLETKAAATQFLLEAGASIGDLNCVRKHLSAIKGGRLVTLLSPRPIVTLALSDVVGDDPAMIGSGPTVPDSGTYRQALDILEALPVPRSGPFPEKARRHLEEGALGLHEETPGPDHPAFRSSRFLLAASNRQACQAAQDTARRLGYTPQFLGADLTGDTKDCAARHARLIREASRRLHPGDRPLCLVSGGETTVRVTGDGLGGRNQEFVLALVHELAALSMPILAASLGTDGFDGPTDSAGAMATGQTMSQALRLGMEPEQFLLRNDSHTFFNKVGGLLRTGPTGTNVMDLRIVLLAPPSFD